MALGPGSRLGPYQIVNRTGAGGMGEVYRARDTRLDRTVAIMELFGGWSKSRRTSERAKDDGENDA